MHQPTLSGHARSGLCGERSTRARARTFFRLLGLLAVAVLHAGCSGGTSSSRSNEVDGQIAGAAAVQGGPVLALLAAQHALAQVATSSFTGVADSVACIGTGDVSATGNTTAGTVTIDLTSSGLCQSPYGAFYGGTVASTYTVSAGSVTVTSTFTDVAVRSTDDDTLQIDGTLTVIATTAGSPSTASLAGTLTVTDGGGRTRTVVYDLTPIEINDANRTITIQDGDAEITDPIIGQWDVRLQGVRLVLDPSAPCVNAGLITGSRLGVNVSLQFTACNQGDVLVNTTVVAQFTW